MKAEKLDTSIIEEIYDEDSSNQEEMVVEDQKVENSDNDHLDSDVQENEHNEVSKSEDDEVVVSIGEDSPPQDEFSSAPEWVKRLRKSHREQEKKIREYEAKLQAVHSTENNPVVLGSKPTLESCDYDADKFEAAVDEWYAKKRVVDQEKEKALLEDKQKQEAWNNRLQEYGTMKGTLRVSDYEEAEESVQQSFSITQQGIILQGCENPALVVYALGKHPKRTEELSKISDPVKFAFSIAKLERDLKVTPKKNSPTPEKIVSGTARVSGSIDSKLEKLRADAEKTNDYSEVNKYRTALKERQK